MICNVTGKEMLGRGRTGRRFAKLTLTHTWSKGCRKKYWCIFCENYHVSKALRGHADTTARRSR